MMLVHGYTSKKDLSAHIGEPLNYEETSMFGQEFKSDGSFMVAHRPLLLPAAQRKGKGREFFATVTMERGLIKAVK